AGAVLLVVPADRFSFDDFRAKAIDRRLSGVDRVVRPVRLLARFIGVEDRNAFIQLHDRRNDLRLDSEAFAIDMRGQFVAELLENASDDALMLMRQEAARLVIDAANASLDLIEVGRVGI